MDEWQNMRSMFVNDEFRNIADAKDRSSFFNKVCKHQWLYDCTIASRTTCILRLVHPVCSLTHRRGIAFA